MFSLIITIISIALVAALALATLYYGGETFNQGRADAQAAKLINQGQQLLGASELFYNSKGRWPNDVPELVSEGFLSTVPVAQGGTSSAWAAQEWEMPVAQVPVFVTDPVDTEVCGRVNHKAYGLDGVLPKLYSGLIYQCWGSDEGALQTVVARTSGELALAFDPDDLEPGEIPPITEEDKWTVIPPDGPGPEPEEPLVSFRATQVSVGGSYACALTSTGGIKCWGVGAFGAFGEGYEENNSLIPRDVATLTSGASLLRAGNSHACAMVAGSLKCWGMNNYGQLGSGVINEWDPVPVQTVQGLASVSALSVGEQHTCAISGGTAYCWGKATGPAWSDSPIPVAMSTLGGTPVQIATGSGHSCAVLSTGQVQCWGAGLNGELGHGANGFIPTTSPVYVSGISDAVSIVAGMYHTCVTTSSGGVKCWGANTYGSLGNGGTTDSNVPVDVLGLTASVTGISAGGSHTCVTLATGGVQCWGQGQLGKLGNGSDGDSSTAVAVTGLKAAAVEVSAGSYSTCARFGDGSLQCWGLNSSGQLGTEVADGFNTTPVDVAATIR